MDTQLFLKLISNLLDIPVFDGTDMDDTLKHIEENYCINKTLQPMYTADALHYLIRSAKPNVLYEIIDYLNISISFFIFDSKIFLLGPYAKGEFSESAVDELLIKNKLPSSMVMPLRLYCTKFNIITTNQIQNTITQVLSALEDTTISFDYRRLSGFIADTSDINSDEKILSETNYSEIYRRYDSENRFLNAIRLGDIDNVFNAFSDMTQNSFTALATKEVRSYYLSPASFSIIIALTRKAAEQSGLSVITINNITQKYVQRFSVKNNKSHQNIIADYIVELVNAVKEHRLSYASYSKHVVKAIQYMDLHLSDPITIEDIAAAANLSVSHFSRIFKSEVGETAMSTLAKMRCKKAATLLKETNLPIGEISSFVGYSDNNYFVKVFKKTYGDTPSDFRKRKPKNP